MARTIRGLPDNFALDLPDEKPVVIVIFWTRSPACRSPDHPRERIRRHLKGRSGQNSSGERG